MEHIILVVDIGTQSLRVSLVTDNRGIIAFNQQKYEKPYFSPKKGYAEQNADFYIDTLIKASIELKKEYPSDFEAAEAIVIVTFRDTAVILDENMKPLRPAILWLDQRTADLKDMHFLKLYERALFKVLGMTDTVIYNAERTAAQWLKLNENDNYNKMKYYAPLSAYFNYRLTGNLVVSSADCIGHYPLNYKKRHYYSKLHPKVDVFAIPIEKLPPVIAPKKVIGYITKEFSLLSGIKEGLPLISSGSDKACETFGDGIIDKDTAAISLGTACTIDVVSNKYKEPEAFLPSYETPYGEGYDYEVQIYRGFYMIRWFYDEFGIEDKENAKKKGVSLEAYLDSMISSINPGCDGLVLQPYWGPGLKRPNARGSIIGFSAAHTRYHLYRAIIEGIGFALLEGLETIMKKTHKKPKYIVASGGGAHSDVILHIMSDIFGIEIRKPKDVESTTIGGAMSAFLSIGVYSSPKEAINKMVKIEKIIKPDMKNHEIYQYLYKNVYKPLYPSVKTIYHNSKKFFLMVNKDE